MAATAGEYTGSLIGLDSYTKENKTTITYSVLVAQRPDPKTGLYTACEICNVRESEEVIKEPKKDMKVHFYGELSGGKEGKFMRYSGIEVIK